MMSTAMKNRQTQVGSCTYCSRKCHQHCERCGDPYCSVQCQQHDWPRHRYYCLPMPRLVTYSSVNYNEIPSISGALNNMKISDNNEQPRSNASTSNRSQCSDKSEGSKGLPSSPGLPKAGSQVYLMSFRTTNRCFARPYSVEADLEYKKILERINEYGKSAPLMQTTPKKDHFAIASWNGQFSRFKIINFNKVNNTVYGDFIDLGERGQCDAGTLRVISDEVIALPKLLFLVQLNNTQYVTTAEDINKTMSEVLYRPYILRYTDKDCKYVELVYPQTGLSVNDRINKILLSQNKQSAPAAQSHGKEAIPTAAVASPKVPGSGGNLNGPSTPQQIGKVEVAPASANKENKSPPAVNIPDIKAPSNSEKETAKPKKDDLKAPFKLIQWPPSKDGIEAIIMDNSCVEDGFIGCIQTSDVPKIASVLKYLATYKAEEKPHRPICGEFVLAKFEGGWYRAKVMDVDCDAILVYYVDFTNESTVSVNDIRAYPRDGDSSLYSNCYSVLCSLEGLREAGIEIPLNEKQTAVLKNGVLGDSEKIIIDEVKEEFELITPIVCTSVIKELEKQ